MLVDIQEQVRMVLPVQFQLLLMVLVGVAEVQVQMLAVGEQVEEMGLKEQPPLLEELVVLVVEALDRHLVVQEQVVREIAEAEETMADEAAEAAVKTQQE